MLCLRLWRSNIFRFTANQSVLPVHFQSKKYNADLWEQSRSRANISCVEFVVGQHLTKSILDPLTGSQRSRWICHSPLSSFLMSCTHSNLTNSMDIITYMNSSTSYFTSDKNRVDKQKQTLTSSDYHSASWAGVLFFFSFFFYDNTKT